MKRAVPIASLTIDSQKSVSARDLKLMDQSMQGQGAKVRPILASNSFGQIIFAYLCVCKRTVIRFKLE